MTTLTVLRERLWDEFTVRKALVIAPKNVAENVWAQECDKWEHLSDIRCSLVTGSAEKRRRALAAPAELYIINRENVVWLLEELGGGLPFQMIVLDELSSFKNPQSQRWKALRKVRPQIRRIIGLTGTPRPNGLEDLWAEIYLLDRGERLGHTIGGFRTRYLKPERMNGYVVYSYVPLPGAEDMV